MQIALFPSCLAKKKWSTEILFQADSLDDTGWNVDIVHWDDFPKLLQAIHILDLTAELGAVENRNQKTLFHYLIKITKYAHGWREQWWCLMMISISFFPICTGRTDIVVGIKELRVKCVHFWNHDTWCRSFVVCWNVFYGRVCHLKVKYSNETLWRVLLFPAKSVWTRKDGQWWTS